MSANRNASKVIGYTRTGKPVLEPTRGAPDTNNIDTFRKTKAKFEGWTRRDHMDASHLLLKHAALVDRAQLMSRCTRWSSVHWDIGGRWTSPEFDAYIKEAGS